MYKLGNSYSNALKTADFQKLHVCCKKLFVRMLIYLSPNHQVKCNLLMSTLHCIFFLLNVFIFKTHPESEKAFQVLSSLLLLVLRLVLNAERVTDSYIQIGG